MRVAPFPSVLVALLWLSMPAFALKPAAPVQPHTSADFKRAERQWFERVAFAPFRERAAGQPWEAEGVAFVGAAFDAWEPASAYEFDEALAARGQKLLRTCKDPLVRYLAARMQYFCTADHFWHSLDVTDFYGIHRRDLEVQLKEAMAALKQLEALNTPRGFLRLIALHAATESYQVNKPSQAETLYRQVATLAREALADGSYQLPAEEELLVGHFFRKPYGRRAGDYSPELRGDVEKAALSEWARLALLGVCDWTDRVRARAAKRTDEAEALRQTRNEKWAKAWKLKPDRPELAAMLFDMISDEKGLGDEEAREWFNRAVAAEVDYPVAYDKMFTQMGIGDWRGNAAGRIAFGRVCVGLGRFDTAVPLSLLDAIKSAANITQPWQPLVHDAETPAALVKLGRGMVDEPSRKVEQQRWSSLHAVWAWLAREDRIAAEALAALPRGKLHPAAVFELQSLFATPAEMSAEVAVRNSPARENYLRGEQLFDEGKLAESHAAYEAALAQAPQDGPAPEWLRARRGLVEIEQALAKGEWVKIPTALGYWNPRAGTWKNGPDGALVLEGDGRPAVIRLRTRVGFACEWRGEFTFNTGRGRADFGAVFRSGTGNHFVQCGAQESGKAELMTVVHEGFFLPRCGTRFPAKPENQKVPRAETNRFLVRTTGEKVSFELNGQNIFSDVHWSPTRHRGNEQVGLAAEFTDRGRTVTFRNLELRQIETTVSKDAK